MKKHKGIFVLLVAGLFLFGSVNASDDEIQRISIMLKNMSMATTEDEKITEVDHEVWQINYLTKYSPYEARVLADAYVRLKTSGLKEYLDAIVWANASFGGSSEALHQTAVIIQQMASNARVSLTDLSQLNELIPNASNLMARATGLSEIELKNKVSKGTVNGKPATLVMLNEMDRQFAGFAIDTKKVKDSKH
jgi:tape measure domain-containing protein